MLCVPPLQRDVRVLPHSAEKVGVARSQTHFHKLQMCAEFAARYYPETTRKQKLVFVRCNLATCKNCGGGGNVGKQGIVGDSCDYSGELLWLVGLQRSANWRLKYAPVVVVFRKYLAKLL